MKPESFIIMVCFVLGACSSSSEPPPPPPPTPDIDITYNVPYTSELMLDVYAPTDGGSFPVVVAIHGGDSHKGTMGTLSRQLVEEGIVVFTIAWHSSAPTSKENYLKGWEDAACAVRFVRQHAAEYDGDPSRIIVVGYSAGGAAGATITLAGDDFSGDCLAEEGSALPDGFVGLDSPYRILDHVSPDVLQDIPEDTVNLIDPFDALERSPLRQDVEFILFAGDEVAETVIVNGDFLQALLSKGYSAELTQFTSYDHTDYIHYPRTEIIGAIATLAN